MAKHSGKQSYNSWCGMRSRCLCKSSFGYPYYGAVGIKICESWRSYKNFVRDMGEPGPGMQLDRIDSSGDYCKENCRWATRQQNMANRKGWGKYKTKGIFQRASGNWSAVMTVNGRKITAGTFKTEIEAAKAFDEMSYEWYGKFAYTNEKLGIFKPEE